MGEVVVNQNMSADAEALIKQLGKRLDEEEAFGSFSVSIYDTAWLARIPAPRNENKWLFPECFEYLLETQSSTGDWASQASDLDGILNTMAALVALKEHLLHSEACETSTLIGLETRVKRAECCLRSRLQEWDVGKTVHVATEILVPMLLSTLEQDGSYFAFPGRETLMSMSERKLSRFRPEMLYSPVTTTLVHSLEAFVGKIDYNRVSHHLDTRGSMLGSPAATAAYLMNCLPWDDTAEAYLKNVVKNGSGKRGGGVPGAYPSSTFELAWIVSSLLKVQSHPVYPDIPEAVQIRDHLQSQFELHNGLLGFDSGLLNDSDDTAKAILSLNLLGYNASPKQMIMEFESPDHFRTYKYEQNGSFSANCNILSALLHCDSSRDYVIQINKVSRFLCQAFELGKIHDKWNLCDGYSEMLLAQAFVKLLHSWDAGLLGELPQDLISEQIPLVLTQIAFRTLRKQLADGSWCFNGALREVTAYGVLTLKSVTSLPWLHNFQSLFNAAINSGSTYLNLNRDLWDHNEYIWVAKVTYALPTVARAYIIAALDANIAHSWSDKVVHLVKLPSERIRKMSSFFSSLPLFHDDEVWKVEADVTIGYLYQPRLLRASSSMFSIRDQTEDKYLEYIPFTWIATNRRNHEAISYKSIWEMMMISLLVYRLDEFMETIFARNASTEEFEQVRQMITELCQVHTELSSENQNHLSGFNHPARLALINGGSFEHPEAGIPSKQSMERTRAILDFFISYVLRFPAVTQSPENIRQYLGNELSQCLTAHVQHEADNQCFASQQQHRNSSDVRSLSIAPFESAGRSYYSWLQTVASANTQSPAILRLFFCLVAAPGEPFFLGPRQDYLSSALSEHLAKLCRIYNDYGSIMRDQAEGNLNSLNFLEFHSFRHSNVGQSAEIKNGLNSVDDRVRAMKDDLLFIADFERESLNLVTLKLEADMSHNFNAKDKINAIHLFIDTVDLWSQIYVAKDISNRLR